MRDATPRRYVLELSPDQMLSLVLAIVQQTRDSQQRYGNASVLALSDAQTLQQVTSALTAQQALEAAGVLPA